ncbi:hypothetical protein ACFWJ5_02525 [Streptomyces qaidamensis]|uniref:hypothetical protein n=1 Tax=Streptomyces qaidamensis TaxID=1783515 RepID=UPI0036596F28
MTTAQTAHEAFTSATELSRRLAALRDLYGVLPQLTVTPTGVLVAIPWSVGRQNMREALAGDIAELLGTELTVHGSTDPEDPYIELRALGVLDGVTVQVHLCFPPAPTTAGR